MKIKRTVWLPADIDRIVVDKQEALRRENPGLNITYSDALRSLLSRDEGEC